MNTPANQTSVAEMRALNAAPREPQLPTVRAGFFDLQSFEFMQRVAKGFAASTLVPAAYRSVTIKTDKFGNEKSRIENPNALANCVIALNMAQRMNADPLSLMQNLYIVEGRPSWSSQWIIAAINSCGRFSPLRFEIKTLGEKTVEYATTVWENNERRSKVEKVKITDKVCIAWAKELATGERIESPPVSIEMAVREGWYSKSGSKWQTMDEVMLRYRTASFFGKLYAPELLMGLNTVEESQDIIEVEVEQPARAMVTPSALRDPAPAPAPAPAPPAADGADGDGEITSPQKLPTQSELDAADRLADQISRASLTDVAQLNADIAAAFEAGHITTDSADLLTEMLERRHAELITAASAPAPAASRRQRAATNIE